MKKIILLGVFIIAVIIFSCQKKDVVPDTAYQDDAIPYAELKTMLAECKTFDENGIAILDYSKINSRKGKDIKPMIIETVTRFKVCNNSHCINYYHHFACCDCCSSCATLASEVCPCCGSAGLCSKEWACNLCTMGK